MKIEKYYEDPQTLHVGAEENRAYYIPYFFINEDKRIFLSGDDWKFYWYKNILEVPEEFTKGCCEAYDTIPVPSCVNILGYDKHQYCNVRGPIPFDPPYAPLENPCGAYVKTFELEFLENMYFLNFEGVDSCFYLWVNGEFVGYSQVSHSTSEFDITSFLKVGSNTMSVLVLKWCDGTYFEDQDKLRMTGIFRDVYILRRPKDHIRDFTIDMDVDLDTKTVEVEVELEWKNDAQSVKYQLYSPEGYVIQEIEKNAEESKVKFVISDAQLWSAEIPNLYTLEMRTRKETILQRVGLKKIEIKDAIVYMNGQNVKFKGVNRHDSDAFTGYTISRKQLMHDLMLMKTHNVNAIRTSHYPNAPWAYELYSELGFYIIAEADLETHNTEMVYAGGRVNYNYDDEIILNTSFGMLLSDPVYEKTVLDRIQRCVIRDKNQACVVMWSLGNEAGYGVNMEKAAAWIKEQNPKYLIQYESSIYQMPDHVNDLSNIDLYSRMYMPVQESNNYCNNNPEKPLVLCEYISSMGNGPGDIEDYFEMFYGQDHCVGGFVWEWCDHSVHGGVSVEGKDRFLYGGDFGEFPNEGNFCVDGMIDPNRKPHTGLIEYKNVARPIRATLEDGVFSFYNTMDFVNMKDMIDVEWQLVVNHDVVEEGWIEDFDLEPHEIKAFIVPYNKALLTEEDTYIMLTYVMKEEPNRLLAFVEEGDVLGYEQFLLNVATTTFEIKETKPSTYRETERKILVEGENFRYVFDKFEGTVGEWVVGHKSYLEKSMEYNIWRAPTDDDKKILGEWLKAGYDRKTVRVYDSNIKQTEEYVDVIFHVGIGAVYLQNVLNLVATYRIFNDGTLQIMMDVKKNPVFPYLPRFGVRMFLSKEFEDVCYKGYGPYESYIDKRRSSYYDKFTTKVSDMHVDYIRPQETGSHYGCSYVSIGDDLNEINVSGADFVFNASHYTQEMLADTPHNFEIEESGYTVLCLDSHMSGIGSGSCGPHLIEKYRVDSEVLRFDMVLQVAEKR